MTKDGKKGWREPPKPKPIPGMTFEEWMEETALAKRRKDRAKAEAATRREATTADRD